MMTNLLLDITSATMTGVCPSADDGLQTVGNIALVYQEIAAVEEGGYGTAKKQRTYDAIDDKANLKGFRSKKITYLVLEFIAHGLNHKREQDDHPQPVGSAETGAVEQWERGEEGSAEGDERGEGELPLSARGIDDEATLFFCFSQTENQGVGSLYKHEKHQQGS
jgi:hypothetical protein